MLNVSTNYFLSDNPVPFVGLLYDSNIYNRYLNPPSITETVLPVKSHGREFSFEHFFSTNDFQFLAKTEKITQSSIVKITQAFGIVLFSYVVVLPSAFIGALYHTARLVVQLNPEGIKSGLLEQHYIALRVDFKALSLFSFFALPMLYSSAAIILPIILAGAIPQEEIISGIFNTEFEGYYWVRWLYKHYGLVHPNGKIPNPDSLNDFARGRSPYAVLKKLNVKIGTLERLLSDRTLSKHMRECLNRELTWAKIKINICSDLFHSFAFIPSRPQSVYTQEPPPLVQYPLEAIIIQFCEKWEGPPSDLMNPLHKKFVEHLLCAQSEIDEGKLISLKGHELFGLTADYTNEDLGIAYLAYTESCEEQFRPLMDLIFAKLREPLGCGKNDVIGFPKPLKKIHKITGRSVYEGDYSALNYFTINFDKLVSERIYELFKQRVLDSRKDTFSAPAYACFGLTEDFTNTELERAWTRFYGILDPSKRNNTKEAEWLFESGKKIYLALQAELAAQNKDHFEELMTVPLSNPKWLDNNRLGLTKWVRQNIQEIMTWITDNKPFSQEQTDALNHAIEDYYRKKCYIAELETVAVYCFIAEYSFNFGNADEAKLIADTLVAAPPSQSEFDRLKTRTKPVWIRQKKETSSISLVFIN